MIQLFNYSNAFQLLRYYEFRAPTALLWLQVRRNCDPVPCIDGNNCHYYLRKVVLIKKRCCIVVGRITHPACN